MKLRILSIAFLSATLAIAAITPVNADHHPTGEGHQSAESRSTLALDGYSPVSYIENNRAEKGNPAITTIYQDKLYSFTNAAQRDQFLANPDRYLPAFGGYCAYGMAKDAEFPADPTNFKIVGDRTFIFLRNEQTDTLQLWEGENENRLTRAANMNWERRSGEGPLAHYAIDSNRLGLQGYCPVAYFAVNKPVKGSPDYPVNYRGVTYYIVSAEAAEEFRKNPSKYEPAYGGWCATGMSVEQKFPIDPHSFKIVENRLFLFKNDESVNALELWNKGDEEEQVKKADDYWRSLIEG